MPRFALLAGFAVALALIPQASGRTSGSLVPGAPSGLRAFLLRADEPIVHEFSRTPSFSWSPVAERGGRYQFELASSRTFQDSTLVFKDNSVPFPAETISRQLPWVTGDPYALWAHVRWISNDSQRATPWSKPFGINMQWPTVPQQLLSPEGLIRWSPVDGATSYEVLYTDFVPMVSFQTTTNVADEREYFTFHSSIGYGTIHWRVRAVRNLGKGGATNGLPAVSYGPWSPTYATVNNPQPLSAVVAPTDTVSDAWDVQGKTKAQVHGLTPGFAWTPTAPVITRGLDPGSALYRVYIYSDSRCVNKIFTGSIVGSPAFAPRTIGGPMPLPGNTVDLTAAGLPPYLTGAGSEGNAVDATGKPVKPNEAAASAGGSSSSSSAGSSSGSSADATTKTTGAEAGVDLWDSGWPTGRFYWTVVPVTAVGIPPKASAQAPPGGAATGMPVTYQEIAVGQDACEAGDVMSFGKNSKPVVTVAGRPFVSGVAPSGRMVAAVGAKAEVYAQPIVAWEPTVGASKYQVEVSKSVYPWHAKWRLNTPATSLVLPLTRLDAGSWYYRVRAIDDSLPPGARAVAWSPPTRIKITGDRIAVVK
jgi:hypothetical protein